MCNFLGEKFPEHVEKVYFSKETRNKEQWVTG